MPNYAWSRIVTGREDNQEVSVEYGATVSAKDVGGADALKELQAVGSVRDYPVPDLGAQFGNMSPVQFLREQRASVERAMTAGSHEAPAEEELLLGVGAGAALAEAADEAEEAEVQPEEAENK